MLRLFSLLPLLLIAAACGPLNYDRLSDAGRFEGTVLVMWVEENNSNSGAGKFVYVPSPGDPLKFVRGDDALGASIKVIEPEMMYTDGGTIPRQVQLFKGFSPWGYAPAYMIHDWLFVARHCINDEAANERQAEISEMKFIETAQIIGEAIKALVATEQVQRNDIAPAAISNAVTGPVSYGSWVARGRCAGNRVSEDHRAQIAAALAPQALVLGRSDETVQPVISVNAARLVTSLSY